MVESLLESGQWRNVSHLEELVRGLELASDASASRAAWLEVLLSGSSFGDDLEAFSRKLPRALLLLRLMWRESPHFSSKSVARLCRALSRHVIDACRQWADLGNVFEKGLESAVATFESCVECCRRYGSAYDMVSFGTRMMSFFFI